MSDGLCLQCGIRIRDKKPRAPKKQKYCSRQCVGESQRTKRGMLDEYGRTCAECGKALDSVSPCKSSSHRFCSRQCMGKNKKARNEPPEKNCLLCGNKFPSSWSKAKVLSAKFCSKKCVDLSFTKEYGTKPCEECGAQFSPKNKYSSKKARFCSQKCFGQNLSKRSIAKHVSGKSCLLCGKDLGALNGSQFKRKMYCNASCRYKHISKMAIDARLPVDRKCVACGGDIPPVTPSRIETVKCCSWECSVVWRVDRCNSKRDGTSIEKTVEEILRRNGIPFLSQKWIGSITRYDCFVDPNIVIYADGDYWHNLPGAPERDVRINAKLESMGYRVVRFWEHEIKNTPLFVEQRLIEICSSKEDANEHVRLNG